MAAMMDDISLLPSTDSSWMGALTTTPKSISSELLNATFNETDQGSNPFGILPGIDRCFMDVRLLDVSDYDSRARPEILPQLGAIELVKIIFYVIIILWSIVGNSLVILVVYFNVKMRTTENLYLANLAVADLLVTFFCTWVHLVKDLTSPHYVLSEFFCKVEGSFSIAALAASVFTLTAISIGRFSAVMFPLKTMSSKSHVGKVVVFLWLISLALGAPSALHRDLYFKEFSDLTIWHCDEFWYKDGYYDDELQYCVVTFHAKKFFHGTFTIALYFIPVFIMLISYGLMIWKLRKGAPGEGCQPSRARIKKKVRVTVTIVIVSFIVCWTPLQSLVLYTSFFDIPKDKASIKGFKAVEYAAYFIAFSNSALNPIIYCSFSNSFRQGFKTLFNCSKNGRKGMFSRQTTNWKTLTARTKETNLPNGEEEAMFAEKKNLAYTGNSRNKRDIIVEIGANEEANARVVHKRKDFLEHPSELEDEKECLENRRTSSK